MATVGRKKNNQKSGSDPKKGKRVGRGATSIQISLPRSSLESSSFEVCGLFKVVSYQIFSATNRLVRSLHSDPLACENECVAMSWRVQMGRFNLRRNS